MITLDNISYRYPSGTDAVTNMTASIPQGIHLLLGENGAGKTTLLHIISGLLFPSSGSCEIDGHRPGEREPSVLSKLFFLADNFIFPQSTINAFARDHSPFYPSFSQEMFRENLADFGLTGNEPFKSLSLGNKRKSLLAYAVALRVEVLLLDEPVNGLDLNSKQIFRRILVRNISDTATVIISTHTVSDLETLFDGVIMLRRGQMLITSSVAEIQRNISFISSAVPPADAVFYLQNAGAYRSVVPADSARESDVDFVLLYFAMQSPQAQEVLKMLKPELS